MEVYYWPDYERRTRRLFTEDERKAAELEIVGAPLRWPVIPRTGGARKARVAKGSKGKSGGARIIYYVMIRGDAIYLLDVYAKGEREDLSDDQKNKIRELIEALEAEG
jgi:mRNA-degrading endonuclease RelE of RelBE toxin-antitoxin system